MRKPQLMTPAARAQLMATACDALQQALCKVYDLWCDQHGLPHLSADEQDCHGMQAGQVEWLTRFQDAWSFYEHADGGWTKKNPIPPEYPSWGSFSELEERNRESLHGILEKAAKNRAAEGSPPSPTDIHGSRPAVRTIVWSPNTTRTTLKNVSDY